MKYNLVNTMEDRVMRAINDTMPQLGCCTCSRCKADVAAYTLSRVKPNYILVEEGASVPSQDSDEKDDDTEILQIIVQAADIISANPNHT